MCQALEFFSLRFFGLHYDNIPKLLLVEAVGSSFFFGLGKMNFKLGNHKDESMQEFKQSHYREVPR